MTRFYSAFLGVLISLSVPLCAITPTPNIDDNKPRTGFKIGLNNTIWDTNNDYGSVAAPYLGVFSEFKLADSLYFQPELAISGKGFTRGYSNKQVYKLWYIEVPLLLSYHTPIGLQLYTGPSLAYSISQTIATEAGAVDIDGMFLAYDCTIVAGLGYPFQLGNSPWIFDTRFSGGLIDIPTSLNSSLIKRGYAVSLLLGSSF